MLAVVVNEGLSLLWHSGANFILGGGCLYPHIKNNLNKKLDG